MNSYDRRIRNFKNELVYDWKEITKDEYNKLPLEKRKTSEPLQNGNYKTKIPVEDSILDGYDAKEILLVSIMKSNEEMKKDIATIRGIAIFWLCLTLIGILVMIPFFVKLNSLLSYGGLY